MAIPAGFYLGLLIWFVVVFILKGFYIINQDQRAVKTVFGRAQRIGGKSTLHDPIAQNLTGDELDRYDYPQVRVIMPGGPYFKWPWERIHKVSVATQTVNMAYDPTDRSANRNNTILEAVTKDQLNIGLTGQIRYRASEKNLYAYIFAIKNPLAHVMGYFVSVLRERIANFEAPGRAADLAPEAASSIAQGISINDLRKNLRDINDHMDRECNVSAARYGVVLEASLITGIDPPVDVESALAAINTARNQVSSDISLAQAASDQRIVQSKKAVEIETLKAQGEVESLKHISGQLAELKRQGGSKAMALYVRNIRLSLLDQTKRIIRRESK